MGEIIKLGMLGVDPTFCSHCGGVYTLNKDGTIRAHECFQGGGKYGGAKWVRCAGSHQPPKELS